jgi:predicted ester cyclase
MTHKGVSGGAACRKVPSRSSPGPPSCSYAPEYLNHAASPRFPDHRFAVAEGETVAVRGRMVGMHEGELSGIPPAGERVATKQSYCLRVAEGKVAEHWAVRDDLGMMKQLGVMPS